MLFLNYNRNANYRRINNNEVDYVRDLPKYNSAVASYLYDGIIDVEKDCKALLMELTYAKYLIFNDGKYTVERDFLRKNPLPENNQTSRYLIDILLGYKVFNEKKFKSYVFDDCKKMNLIKDYDLLIVAYIFFVLIGNLFQVLIIVSLFAFTPLIDELGYKVTELGALERDKLIKLKAFLHDFSNIKDVKSEDANIWDEFLPYAVVLEENNNFIIE